VASSTLNDVMEKEGSFLSDAYDRGPHSCHREGVARGDPLLATTRTA
jgi:hypothetical protein